MPKPAPRYPCPVCLGVRMSKLRPSVWAELELDYCPRCGGMWFDEGEVALLRRMKPMALYSRITLSSDAYRMKCHSCQASFERNQPACPACGWRNELHCPACTRPLQAVEQAGLKLDACPRCRGVWFDNVELARLWNVKVDARASAGGAARPGERRTDGFFLGDFVIWDPPHAHHLADTAAAPSPPATLPPVVDGGSAGDVDGAGGVVRGVAEAAGGAVEWMADLASDVFRGISDVVSSALEALGGIDFDF